MASQRSPCQVGARRTGICRASPPGRDRAAGRSSSRLHCRRVVTLATGISEAELTRLQAHLFAIITTGNTSALRGKAAFAGFAPTKAAQRILAESIARELGPKGVHVAYVMIDAVIDLEWTRQMFPNAPDEFFIKPAAIAEEVWHVAHQDRSAWSFNVELRPFRETW